MKTSEYLVAIVGVLLGIGLASGVLTPDDMAAIVQAAEKFAGALLAALSIFGFQVSRGLAKGGKDSTEEEK